MSSVRDITDIMQSVNKITIDSFIPPRIDLLESHRSGWSSSSNPTKVTRQDESRLKFVDATNSNGSELSQLRSTTPALVVSFQVRNTHSSFTESLTRYIFQDPRFRSYSLLEPEEKETRNPMDPTPTDAKAVEDVHFVGNIVRK
jgi:hypothetical protein